MCSQDTSAREVLYQSEEETAVKHLNNGCLFKRPSRYEELPYRVPDWQRPFATEDLLRYGRQEET